MILRRRDIAIVCFCACLLVCLPTSVLPSFIIIIDRIGVVQIFYCQTAKLIDCLMVGIWLEEKLKGS